MQMSGPKENNQGHEIDAIVEELPVADLLKHASKVERSG
jgi:hypothetical protein